MIIEKIYEGIAETRQPMRPGIFRMSLAEACPRREAYTYLGYPEDKQPDSADLDRRKAAAEDGDIHEADIIRRLLAKGFKIWNYGRENQATVKCVDRFGNTWVGHPDLFIEIAEVKYGLDVKGFRDEIVQKYTMDAVEISPGRFVVQNPTVFAKRPWPLMGQMQAYLHSDEAKAQNVQGWFVVAKNKNDASLVEGLIPKDDQYWARLEEKWRYFWNLVDVGRLPERFFERESSECKLCPHEIKCWEKPLLEAAKQSESDLIEDDELHELARVKLEKDEDVKLASKTLEWVENRLTEETIKRNKSRLRIKMIDGRIFSVSVSEQSRDYPTKEGLALVKEKGLTYEKTFPVVRYSVKKG